MMLLSEFPILLTVLCAAFAPTESASYFSGKLKVILGKIKNVTFYNTHGLIWLMIASKIANDDESYEFARTIINTNGGVPKSVITSPTISILIDDPAKPFSPRDCEPVVAFEEWSDWIRPDLNTACSDLLWYLLDGLLIMRDGVQSREEIARYCLYRSAEM